MIVSPHDTFILSVDVDVVVGVGVVAAAVVVVGAAVLVVVHHHNVDRGLLLFFAFAANYQSPRAVDSTHGSNARG